MANLTVQPNKDGTVTLTHYGTDYRHFWVAEVKKRRIDFLATIHGKKGGIARITLDQQEADQLLAAQVQAQDLATLED